MKADDDDEPGRWVVRSEAMEVKVEIWYRMRDPRYTPWCFKHIRHLPQWLVCGRTFERRVRLAFYVELIPSELLGP